MSTQNIDAVRKAIGVGSLGFGVLAMLTPRTLRRAYGDSTSSGGSLDYFGRTWGSRTAVLGALTLMASSDAERTHVANLAAAMNAVDSLAAFTAQDMPGSTRVMAAAVISSSAGSRSVDR